MTAISSPAGSTPTCPSEGSRKPAGPASSWSRRGIRPDVVHTSVLVRATRTAWIALDTMGMTWLPVHRSWRLNERHYGDLQGKDKKATAERVRGRQVKIWRRSYDVRPPDIEPGSEFDVAGDPRYRRAAPARRPAGRMPEGHARAHAPLLGGRHRPRPARRAGRARGRPRQLTPGAGEAPRRHQRRRRSPSSTSRPATRSSTSSTNR